MTEMTPLLNKEQVSAENAAHAGDETVRRTVLVVQSLAGSTFLFLALAAYLIITTGAWQSVAFLFVAGVAEAFVFVDLNLVQRGQIKKAGWLLLGMNSFGAVAASLLYVNLGYVAVPYILITNFFVIRYVMTKEIQRSGWIITVVALLISISTELIDPAWRQTAQLLLTLTPVITAILGIAFLVVVGYQAWITSMRNKLLVALIGVTLVATSVLAVYVYINTNNILDQGLERELGQHTDSISTELGGLLNEQINNLTTLSLNEGLQQAVEASNQAYEGSASTIQAELNKKDAQWQAADKADNNNDPMVQEHLTNNAAQELLEYQSAFPNNIEVFVTDVYGGLAGATNRTSDYYQADENWWQTAYSDGQGAVYISSPEFDESAGALAVLIAMPIRNRETGKITGILRTTYLASAIETTLGKTVGETGQTELFIPGETAYHLHEGELTPVEAGLYKALQAAEGQGTVEMDYEGAPSIVVQAPVRSQEGNPYVDNLGWVVVFHQHQDEAFAPLNAQVRGTLVVMVIVLVLAVAAAFGLALFLVRPITRLTRTAEEVAGGNLDSRAEVTTTDEIGTLASTFNTMTSRLQGTLQGLEERVAERTQSLELAADVGRSVSQVRDLTVMLRDACELIRDEFNLYYVQVYLADPIQMILQLQAGTGNVGAQLLGRGHRLQINTSSINGRAAIEKRTVVISDTEKSATFHPNALLPDTRGEMAVPLIVSDKVVGVLDMQSSQPDVLNEDVLPAFEALAGQLAVAIQNATLLDEAKQARAEVEAQARRLVRKNWTEYLDAIHKPEQIGFVFDRTEVIPLEEVDELPDESRAVSAPISLTGEEFGALMVELEDDGKNDKTSELVNAVARQVAQQLENLRLLDSAERYRFEAEQAARRQTRQGWQEFINLRAGDSLGYLFDLNEVRPYSNGKDDASALNIPLKVRDEAIGKLSIRGVTSDDGESFELANAVAERLSAHIESLRQYDQTQSALAQSEKLFDASSRLTQSTDLQELVAAVVETLGIPVINRAVLGVFDYGDNNEFLSMNIVANWWNGTGHEITPIGTHYPVEVFKTVSLFASTTPVFFNDALHDPRADETTLALAKRQNLRGVAVLPLFSGTRQVGVFMLEAEEVYNFRPEETRLFSSLAPQIATVLENRRQFERAQKQAERETMLNTISQKIQSATSVEAVLQIAARELGHALGAPMTIAQLSMKDQN